MLAAHRASQRASAAAAADAAADGNTEIGEDFGMSQFWYTDACADQMASDLVETALAAAAAAHAVLLLQDEAREI